MIDQEPYKPPPHCPNFIPLLLALLQCPSPVQLPGIVIGLTLIVVVSQFWASQLLTEQIIPQPHPQYCEPQLWFNLVWLDRDPTHPGKADIYYYCGIAKWCDAPPVVV